ncbi:MAG: ABC transporter permease [Candidatus Korarchaeum sp.]
MKVPPFVKVLVKRALVLLLMVVIVTYLTILIANAGGYVDEIMISEIRFNIAQAVSANPLYKGLSVEERNKLIERLVEVEIRKRGLDQPFPVRSLIYLWNALTLDLGRAMWMTSDSGSRLVKLIILERLPQTILLFTTATVIIFLIGILGGLYLSRNFGSLLDKLTVYLSPTSAIPGWFYGIILILIFYSYLHLLPPGGMVDYPPPDEPLAYFLSVLKHMILPVSAWVISSFFIEIYYNRSFFLTYSTEDYVEVARAKGVPPSQIERRYILRPALPPIITSFAFAVVLSWSGAIITETVFNWPGLGRTFAMAIGFFDVPVIVGITVVFAYLIAITTFILEIVYGIVDPRIRAGVEGI